MISERVDELIKIVKDGILDGNRGESVLKVINDQEIFNLELRSIFAKNWIVMGLECEIPNAGDFILRFIGLDPFIVIRGDDGKIRCFFDSCRHRGTMFCVESRGNTKKFMCPYHGWTYDNKGNLVGVSFKDKAYKNLNLREWNLLEINVDVYDGIIFASMEKNPISLMDYLGDAKWYLDIIFKATGGLVNVGPPQRFVSEFDWKLGAENFSEDRIHVTVAHRSMSDLGFTGTSRFGSANESDFDVCVSDVKGHNNKPIAAFGIRREDPKNEIFLGYDKKSVDTFKPMEVQLDQWEVLKSAVNIVFTIFPNFSVFMSADSTDSPSSVKSRATVSTMRVWQPIGPGRTEVWSWTIVPKGVSDELKTRINEVTRGAFGITGNAEMDELAIWSRVTRAAKGIFAERAITSLKGGLEGISQLPYCKDWPGPGICRPTQIHEEAMRTFWKRWSIDMSERDDS